MRTYHQCENCGKMIFNPSPEELCTCSICGSYKIQDGYSPELEDELEEKRNKILNSQ
jgi:predicted  nucleic acid-binding Zn-ribbon protein